MAAANSNGTLVVFVHGLWMTGLDQWWLRRAVARCGYRVKQFTCPTLRCDVKQNAMRLNTFLHKQNGNVATIHLVGHSLGGLVIRQLFHDYPEQRPGRIVTLGTPHNGSAIARIFNRNRIGQLLLGKSRLHGLLGEMPPWRGARDLGVVAGTRDHGIGRAVCQLPKPNDGTVAVEETRLQGMADHIELPVSHSAMLLSNMVVKQVVHFIEWGRFCRP